MMGWGLDRQHAGHAHSPPCLAVAAPKNWFSGLRPSVDLEVPALHTLQGWSFLQ